jgi:metallophosphoesterase superfamily enzyme
MTVHFFYDYKEELVKKLRNHYSESLNLKERELFEKNQIEDAIRLIGRYFDDLEKQLGEVISASNGDIKLVRNRDSLLEFSVIENFLRLVRKDNSIQVIVGYYDAEEDSIKSKTVAHIVPGEKKCQVKKLGQIHDGSTFDENTLNHYMRLAFRNIFSFEDENEN